MSNGSSVTAGASSTASSVARSVAGVGGGVPVPVNLGMTTPGAQAAANASANYVWATGPYLAESSGEIQSVSLYTSQAGVAVSLGVWLDAAGVVGALVAASVAGTTLLNDWVTLAASGDIVAGQKYWIGWNCPAICSFAFDTAAAGTTNYKARTYTAGAQPDPYPSAPTTLPRRYPLYLTYLGS